MTLLYTQVHAVVSTQMSATVQRWVRRFEQDGLEALREGERSGRPSALDAAQWRKLQGDLRKTPRDFGIPATLCDSQVLSQPGV